MISRYTLCLLFICVTYLTFAQEVLINVSLKQPKQLGINAGPDISVENPENIIIGENITVTGGTPGYLYNWSDGYGNNFYSQIITVSSFGSYYLTVTDTNHCTAIDSLQVTSSVNIDQAARDEFITLFPNPASGSVYIPVKDFSDALQLQIISVSGKVVSRRNINLVPETLYHEVYLGNLAKGIYNIVLENNRTRKVYKIVLE